MRYPARLIDDFDWERTLDGGGLFGERNVRTVVKEPVGVVAAITPSNFPIEVILNKLGPALATGNTVVLKPDPHTPWNATRLGRLIAEHTDIPPGVVNVVPTPSNDVAAFSATDPRVDMISFTGSTAVGKHAGPPGRRHHEAHLPGTGRQVGVDRARRRQPRQGRPERGRGLRARRPGVRAHHPHADSRVPVRRRRRQRDRRVPDGSGGGPGPAGHAGGTGDQRDAEAARARRACEQARRDGAEITTGGGSFDDLPAHLAGGHYVQPTVIVGADNSAAIAQEEIFGPVLVIIPFADDDEAVRLANDSVYGLAGAVLSASPERGMSIARRIRTGSIGVNGGMFYGADAPFGGYKSSGIGRQCGIEGFQQYLETKTIGCRMPRTRERQQ